MTEGQGKFVEEVPKLVWDKKSVQSRVESSGGQERGDLSLCLYESRVCRQLRTRRVSAVNRGQLKVKLIESKVISDDGISSR